MSTRDDVFATVAGLDDLLRHGGASVLDVRWELGRTDGHDRYLDGHLPGAVYVDLETELAAPASPLAGRHPLPDPGVLQAAARRWGVAGECDVAGERDAARERNGAGERDAARHPTVVVYDGVGGQSAARAWWLLRWAGHTDVRILDGGIDAWVRSGRSLERGERVPVPGDFVVSPGAMPVLDADDAAGLAASGVLLDARAGERYRGEVEPVDPRAGHIPGALSAPTAGNLAADGTFLPDAALRARFAALDTALAGLSAPRDPGGSPGADNAPEEPPVGVYCGSGVTAAHEVAALAAIGVEAALYPGSWSQWSNDPRRPAATGATGA